MNEQEWSHYPLTLSGIINQFLVSDSLTPCKLQGHSNYFITIVTIITVDQVWPTSLKCIVQTV